MASNIHISSYVLEQEEGVIGAIVESADSSVITTNNAPEKTANVSFEVSNIDSLLSRRVTSSQSDFRTIFGKSAQYTSVSTQVAPKIADPHKFNPDVYTTVMACSVFIMYTVIVYMYKQVIVSVFKAAFFRYSGDKLIVSLDININKMILSANIMLILSIVLFLYGMTTQLGLVAPDSVEGRHLMPIIIGVVALVVLYRIVAHNLITHISNNAPFFDRLKFNNRIIFSFWALIFTPLVLICCLAPESWFYILKYIVLAAFALLIIQHLFRCYMLFLEKKVSFLQYILYLCATELLPVSFLIILVTRGGM